MALRYGSAAGRLVLAAAILGSGMAFLDSTAVNVALPAIEADLHTGFAGLQWILDGYLVALAALVLPGGALGDRFGRRRIFLIGLAWFGAASALCGLAPNTAVLIGARVLQGVGAALLVPSSLSMLQGAFAAPDRGQAIGAWSGFSGLTTLIGPLLGGWLADAVSWRLVFLINPILAIVPGIIAWRAVPESSRPRAGALDPAGTAAGAVALTGLVFALIEGPERGWGDGLVLASAAIGAAAFAGFIMTERYVDEPMLPLGFFRRVRFAAVTAVTIPVYFALGGVTFLLVLQLQRVLGYSALAAGASLAPVTLLLLVLSPVAGRLVSRNGPRLLMTAGPLTAACGVALMSTIDAGATYVVSVLPAVLVFGAGLGLTVAPLTATAMAALEDEHAGLASGVSNAVTRAAQLLAVSLLPLAAGLSGLDRIAGTEFSEGFQRAMWIAAGVMGMAATIAGVTIRGPLRQGGTP